MLTGGSAAELVGLAGEAHTVELYASMAGRDAIVDEHALTGGSGDVTIRWVPDEVWVRLDVAAPTGASGGGAHRSA